MFVQSKLWMTGSGQKTGFREDFYVGSASVRLSGQVRVGPGCEAHPAQTHSARRYVKKTEATALN